jgi:prepilin-type processing-associated H-X9-DG protein
MTDPGAREQSTYVRPRRAMVTDGLSHTAMISERAGRPGYWVNDKQESETNTLFGFDGGWASYQSVWPRTFEADGKTIVTTGVGERTINCNNGFGVYAFHAGGANVVFGDGAVRFLNEKINSYVYLALLSRQRGEVLDTEDYESR